MTLSHKVKSHGQLVGNEITQVNQPESTFLDEKLARIEAIDLEKQEHNANKTPDSEEDLDALIRELEAANSDDETNHPAGSVDLGNMPHSDTSQTDITYGLSASEVVRQRKKHGLNQLREEKVNLFLKFVMFFVGPIQFVMEVRLAAYHTLRILLMEDIGCRHPCRWTKAIR